MVILRDASFTDVEGLVRYVYRGEVDVQPDQLQSFLSTAELLKIKGLADQNICGAGNQEEEEEGKRSSPTQPPPPPQDKVIAPSPIKVPVPPKRNTNFTSLAQYLSGSQSPSASLSPPPHDDTAPAANATNTLGTPSATQSSSKRRKTTPKRYTDSKTGIDQAYSQQKQHYSGSTSSLTASPSSPPHSHSTEGGDITLEICEDSDRYIHHCCC